MIPALRRQKQAGLCEFEACLVYRVSSKIAKDAQRNPVSKKERRARVPVATQRQH